MANRTLDPSDPGDRRTIIRQPTRLTAARLCRREGQTIPQLARRMGMDDGALRGTVKKMVAWGVLLVDPRSSANRRIYRFSPNWEEDLRDAVRRHRPLDLIPGQRAVLIDQKPPQGTGLGDVAWVIEFDQGEQALLAVADDAPASAHSLRDELRKRGVAAESVEVGDPWNPARRAESP